MSKCQFNKDALQHLRGTEVAIFKGQYLMNASVFCS